MVNKEIMQELLDHPDVKRNVEQMTPAELNLFKRLLIKNGIYDQYVKERERERPGI